MSSTQFKRRDMSLFPGFAGNKAKYEMPSDKAYSLIIDPFLGGGGALIPLMLKYPKAQIICADTSPFTRSLFKDFVSGNLNSYYRNACDLIKRIHQEAPGWEEAKLLYKQIWNDCNAGLSDDYAVGLLKCFCHSTIERQSSNGLNVSFSGDKVYGTKLWKEAGNFYLGPKPKKRSKVIEYNSELGELLYQEHFIPNAVARIQRWYQARLAISEALAEMGHDISIYGNCYDIPVLHETSGWRLIVSDAPYYIPEEERYVDSAGKKRTRRATPSYGDHKPQDITTWKLTEFWANVALMQRYTDYVVWNYASPEYDDLIMALRSNYPSTIINADTVTSCVNVPSMYYRREALSTETGVFFRFD